MDYSCIRAYVTLGEFFSIRIYGKDETDAEKAIRNLQYKKKMKHLVVFTGAGISAESGIDTFRAQDGLWKKHDANKVSSIDAWQRNKALILDFFNQRKKEMLQAQPNPAHLILAELEKHFRVSIITQNIDNLHEKAGSTTITNSLVGHLK
jgi:NAD-dependent SIR2 family protein deacetylase